MEFKKPSPVAPKLSNTVLKEHNKREAKFVSKEVNKKVKSNLSETASVTPSQKSERSNLSSRNMQGEKIREHHFVRKGEQKGKQNWQCMKCRRKSNLPEKHRCE